MLIRYRNKYSIYIVKLLCWINNSQLKLFKWMPSSLTYRRTLAIKISNITLSRPGSVPAISYPGSVPSQTLKIVNSLQVLFKMQNNLVSMIRCYATYHKYQIILHFYRNIGYLSLIINLMWFLLMYSSNSF